MASHIDELQGLTVEDFLQPDTFLPHNDNFVPSPNDAPVTSSSSSHFSSMNSANSSTLSPPLSFPEQDSSDDSVIFSDFVFSYIDSMLMEEERNDAHYNPADMFATEQQLTAILGGGPTDEPPLTQVLAAAQPPDFTPPQTVIDWPSFTSNTGDDNIPYDITSNDHSLFYGDADDHITFGGLKGWQHDPVDFNQLHDHLLFANANSFSSFSSLSPTTTTNTNTPLRSLPPSQYLRRYKDSLRAPSINSPKRRCLPPAAATPSQSLQQKSRTLGGSSTNWPPRPSLLSTPSSTTSPP